MCPTRASAITTWSLGCMPGILVVEPSTVDLLFVNCTTDEHVTMCVLSCREGTLREPLASTVDIVENCTRDYSDTDQGMISLPGINYS